MASKPRALQDLMTAVDTGHVVIDSGKLMAPRRSTYDGRGRKPGAPPAPVAVETSSDTSFEFSAVVSYSSASPASMVFSDGQLRAHQFPAVRSSADSSQAPSQARGSASVGSAGGGRASRAAGATMGSKKRVSFAADGAAAAKAGAGGGQGKKSGGGGGLLGCMALACGASRHQVVEPARSANRKVVAV